MSWAKPTLTDMFSSVNSVAANLFGSSYDTTNVMPVQPTDYFEDC